MEEVMSKRKFISIFLQLSYTELRRLLKAISLLDDGSDSVWSNLYLQLYQYSQQNRKDVIVKKV